MKECFNCNETININIPKAKILMLFTKYINWDTFEDDHTKNQIYDFYAFSSVKSFMDTWREVVNNPDGPWYWVIDVKSGDYICSGACDPDDEEIFKEYFGKKR